MSNSLWQHIQTQWDDTIKVVIALLKGFVVAAAAYFVSLALTIIMRRIGGTDAAEALEFCDGYIAALTYVAVAGKDLIELTFK